MKTHCEHIFSIILLVGGLQACSSDDNNKPDPTPEAGSSGGAPVVDHDAGTKAGAGGAAGSVMDNDAGSKPEPTPTGRKAYIGLFGDSAVGVLDTGSQRMLKSIPVSAPDGLIITPDGRKVFVSSGDTSSVKVIDTTSDSEVASIDVGSKPAGLSITPDGKLVVASVGGADEAVLIDAATNQVVRHVAVGQAHSSCITSDSRYAYVGSQVTTAPAVVKVDLQQDTPPQSYSVDKSPRALACERDRIYFTAVGLDAIEQFDPTTGKLDATIASDGSPHDVRAAEPGQLELVVSQTAGDLEFIDVPSASVVAKVPTGKLAHWIALMPDHHQALVTNEGDNNVSVVDLDKHSVLAQIDVGQAPRKIALQP